LRKINRRPQRALAFVVGGLGVAPLQEHEQLVAAVDIHRISQPAALGIGRLEREQPLQFPFEAAAMRGNGGVGEALAGPIQALDLRFLLRWCA